MTDAAYLIAIAFLTLIAGFEACLLRAACFNHHREREAWRKRETAYLERLTGLALADTAPPARSLPRSDEEEWRIERERLGVTG